jgi:arylsulfatase A-like enzyme
VIREEEPDNSWGYLSPRAVLLPKLLKPAGYHTAIIGKWHLGLSSPNTPTERGFDLFEGFLGDMMDDYWTHLRHGQNFMRHNADVVQPQGHATDVFTDWACQYLQERARDANRDQPFSSIWPTTRRTIRSSHRRNGWTRCASRVRPQGCRQSD